MEKSTTPFFSIIIATLNNLTELKQCISSINNQDFLSYEVLISDGGSSDGTQAYLKSNEVRNLTWSKSSYDDGIYCALNSAIPYVAGSWVLVLGSDDYLVDATALSRAYFEIVRLKNSPCLIYSDLYISNAKNLISLKFYPPIEEFNSLYGGAAFIHHQSAIISATSIKGFGGFNQKFRIHADYDLMIKVMKTGKAVKIGGAYVVFWAYGYSSNLKNAFRSIGEIIRIRLSHGYAPLSFRLILLYLKVILVRIFQKIISSWRVLNVK